MLATTSARIAPFRGLRRLDVSRDLGDVAGLIDEAFANEPDHAGRAIASEFRSLSRFGPLLWLLDRISLGYQDWFTGFVWVEEGRVVGNVSLNREGDAPGRWLVSNVAVAAPYRGRGVGQQLMRASLDFLRSRRAKVAFLMVRRENEGAIRLYRDLGFVEVGGKVTLRRETPPDRLNEPPLEAGWKLRDVRFNDARALYDLARAATPEPLLHVQPAHYDAWAAETEEGPGEWLLAKLGHKTSYRWVLEERGTILAHLRLEISRKKYHRVRLTVHPSARGRVELALLSRALNLLQRAPVLPVLADVGGDEAVAMSLLRAWGFAESRWLVVMSRRMDMELGTEE